MHQYADIYLLQRQTLRVLGVTAPILRSSIRYVDINEQLTIYCTKSFNV
jgi:hypothetical protein